MNDPQTLTSVGIDCGSEGWDGWRGQKGKNWDCNTITMKKDLRESGKSVNSP